MSLLNYVCYFHKHAYNWLFVVATKSVVLAVTDNCVCWLHSHCFSHYEWTSMQHTPSSETNERSYPLSLQVEKNHFHEMNGDVGMAQWK